MKFTIAFALINAATAAFARQMDEDTLDVQISQVAENMSRDELAQFLMEIEYQPDMTEEEMEAAMQAAGEDGEDDEDLELDEERGKYDCRPFDFACYGRHADRFKNKIQSNKTWRKAGNLWNMFKKR